MTTRTKKFKTEVKQLLDLVIHSLYSKKEIFLRELISNASDALDRARFEALTDSSMTTGDEAKIAISTDAERRTLTISDNGIGMSAAEVETHIGTIASSGTRTFVNQMKEANATAQAELIGQFGVGFYSAFMVADRVTLLTRRAGKGAEAVRWSSDGEGDYTIDTAEKEGQGTDVTLHLREDQTEFLQEWRLRELVKAYSDYIAYPIELTVHRKEKKEGADEEIDVARVETLNSRKALWKRAKSDITDEEYHEFYRHISHDHEAPAKVIHYTAEGATEFKALLYLPAHAPSDLFMPDRQRGVHLYVKNVFIMDNCTELLPPYLRFTRGVVDSSDLPLNVSREMLQDDALLRRIRKNLVSKLLATLADMKIKEPDAYVAFYEAFGPVLKEGLHFDFENAEKLKELLMFHTSATPPGKRKFLKDYVDGLPEAQKELYYLSAESVETAAGSPLLEACAARGFEALFFVDPIDEWILPQLASYGGKQLKAIDQATIEKADKKEAAESESAGEQVSALCKAIQERLSDELKAVRASRRLTDSACCLVNADGALPPHIERMMRAMKQETPKTKRILEINPDHPHIARLAAMAQQAEPPAALAEHIELLYDQALIAEGRLPRNPGQFSRRLGALLGAIDRA